MKPGLSIGEPQTVRVRALEMGFHDGQRYREGAEFDFTTTRRDDKGAPVLAKWMQLASQAKPKPKQLGLTEADSKREKAARAREEAARERAGI